MFPTRVSQKKKKQTGSIALDTSNGHSKMTPRTRPMSNRKFVCRSSNRIVSGASHRGWEKPRLRAKQNPKGRETRIRGQNGRKAYHSFIYSIRSQFIRVPCMTPHCFTHPHGTHPTHTRGPRDSKSRPGRKFFRHNVVWLKASGYLPGQGKCRDPLDINDDCGCGMGLVFDQNWG